MSDYFKEKMGRVMYFSCFERDIPPFKGMMHNRNGIYTVEVLDVMGDKNSINKGFVSYIDNGHALVMNETKDLPINFWNAKCAVKIGEIAKEMKLYQDKMIT